jgi:hypothetical protein
MANQVSYQIPDEMMEAFTNMLVYGRGALLAMPDGTLRVVSPEELDKLEEDKADE